MTRIALVLALGFCLLLISSGLLGCGGSSSTPAGGSSSTPGCMTNCSPGQKTEVLYSTALNGISSFTINTSTGTLSAAVLVAGPNDSAGIASSPAANLLFASDFTADAINVYSISTRNGSLTPIAGSPFSLGNTPGAAGLVLDPAGKFLYESDANAAAINGFSVASTGAVFLLPGAPFPAGNTPAHVAIAPDGKFLYASDNNDSLGGISAYTVNSSTGALTAVPGSPFTTQASFGGPGPLAVHSSGKFLYVAMPGTVNADHLIFAFTIDRTTGALGPIAGSPFNTGNDPLYLSLDPAGRFLYVSNVQDNTVSGFTIKATNGSLTPIIGSPYSVPSVAGLAVEPSGKFLYVSSANTIAGFSIDSSTGALTAIKSSPFAAPGSGILSSTTIK